MKPQTAVTTLVVICVVLAQGAYADPTPLPDGADMQGSHVVGHGTIPIDDPLWGDGDQTHEEVRDIVVTAGQMAGVATETGYALANEDLLTLKPRKFDIETDAGKRVFVISADQITAGANVTINYDGEDIVISFDGNMGGGDLTSVGSITFDDGSVAIERGNIGCRFSGELAGDGASGENVIGFGNQAARGNSGSVGLGYIAACGNKGSYVNALGTAAYLNEASFVNALGYFAARANTGYFVNGIGHYALEQNAGGSTTGIGLDAGKGNTGSQTIGIGTAAAMGNHANCVQAIGYNAGMNNGGGHVTMLGHTAGSGNSGSYCFFAGTCAGENNDANNVIAIGENISGSELEPNSCYLDGDLRLKDCNGKGGGTELHFANGATIGTTADTFDFNGATLANMLIAPMGDIGMGDYDEGSQP